MKIEVLRVCRFIAPAQVDLIWRRVPFGRKDEGEVVASWVGCGFLNLIDRAQQPMVVDADAINVLSGKIDVLRRCAGPRARRATATAVLRRSE